MHDNIGRKIKTLAKVVAWIGIIVSVVAGICTITMGVGILIIIFGSLFSWLSTLVLYGFGQLIENTDILVQQNMMQQPNWQHTNVPPMNPQPNMQYNPNNYRSDNSQRERKNDVNSSARYCANCGKIVTGNFCPTCGTSDLKDMPARDNRQ